MKHDKGIYYHGTWAGYGHAIVSRGFELGHEGRGNLLGPHFHRAIPQNKKLTQFELIQLCSYVLLRARRKRSQYILRARKGKKAAYNESWLRLSRLHEQVKRFGYETRRLASSCVPRIMGLPSSCSYWA